MNVLVAGIGNIFFGDDAFGCEVARRLAQRPQRDGVTVVDFGIRGYDLAMRLDAAWDAVILVDAASRRGAPGTLYVIEPSLAERTAVEPHAMNPVAVLAEAYADRAPPSTLRLVACEPASFDPDGMSPEVAAAIDPAVAMVERLIATITVAHA